MAKGTTPQPCLASLCLASSLFASPRLSSPLLASPAGPQMPSRIRAVRIARRRAPASSFASAEDEHATSGRCWAAFSKTLAGLSALDGWHSIRFRDARPRRPPHLPMIQRRADALARGTRENATQVRGGLEQA
ncbi:hypothetical protein RJ55_00764 [Drechmeria coniospora]|nr:hypothetical protein RJ55_00764 [Drechmeria coniospora]